MVRMAKAMKQQGFSVPFANWGGNAYDPTFVTADAAPATNGSILDLQLAMFAGEDAATLHVDRDDLAQGRVGHVGDGPATCRIARGGKSLDDRADLRVIEDQHARGDEQAGFQCVLSEHERREQGSEEEECAEKKAERHATSNQARRSEYS